ncbi:MAG: PAS domain S-box protein [Thermoplasmatota archaeon]
MDQEQIIADDQIDAIDYDDTERANADGRFKILFDTMKQGVVHQAMNGRIIIANRAAEEILGVSLEEMMERTSEDPEWAAIREDGTELPGEEHPSMVALRTGEKVLDFVMGVYNPRKDGRIWIKVDAIPLFMEDESEPYEVYTVFEDISEKLNLEKKLTEGEERYRSLFDSAGDAIMITRITPEGPKFEACNRKAAELFRVEKGKLCGMDPMKISPPAQPNGENSAAAIMENVQRVMRGETVHIEWVHRRVDGTDFPCEVTLSAIQSQQGPLIQAIVRDITERKTAEEKISRGEGKFRLLVETTPDGISTTDLNGTMTSINPANLDMLGYDNEDEVLGRSSLELIIEDQRERALKGFEQTLSRGKIGPIRYDLIRKDGTTFPAELIVSLVRDKGGQPESFIAVTRDISDRIVAEKELQDSESRYRLLIETATETILVAQDGLIKFTNPAGPKLLGYSMENVIDKHFLDFIHPDDRKKVGERYQKRVRGEMNIPRYPFRLIDVNGKVKWVEVEAVVIPWEGRPATLNFLSDVTHRMEFEEALMESEEKYRSLINNISDGIFELKNDGTFEYASPNVSDIFGFKYHEVIGRNFTEFIHPDDHQRIAGFFQDLLRGEIVPNFELSTRHKDGHQIHISCSAKLKIKNDGTRSVVAVLRDVTDKIRTQRQIETEKNRAEFYLDLLSHDIGNIHQGLLGWTEIARFYQSDLERRNKALNKITELENRSLRLVRNVLMLSRLKEMELDFQPVDIIPLLTKAINDIRSTFCDREVDISSPAPLHPAFVVAEPVIEEAFFNLLHNSVKFQYDDPVRIEVSVESSDDEIIINIADHGIGIPGEQKEQLFDRHLKGSDHGYSGIGLSLVKELVTRYDGRIEVRDRIEGEPGKGARFMVHLKRADT